MAQTEPTSAEQDRAALLSVVTEKGGGGGQDGKGPRLKESGCASQVIQALLHSH